MAGNNSTVGLETVTFTDNMSFDGTERGGAMTTNGELWIGSTTGRHVKKGSLTSPDGSVTISYSSPNITLANDLGTGRFPITPYVVGPVGDAGYQTIQSAINAANAAGGGVVYIQPTLSPYTENLTLFNNVDLYGTPAVSQNQGSSVTVIGTHTPPTTGKVALNSICFVSTTDVLSSVAAGSCHISFVNCETAVQNGYTANLPNWTGILEFFDNNPSTAGAPFAVNDGGINNTGGATILIFSSGVGSGTNVMNLSGFIILETASIGCPINFHTGSIINAQEMELQGAVTLSNNSTGLFYFCQFDGGASAAITMSSSAAISVVHAVVTSSNNPAIAGAGAGTFTYSDLVFTSNATIAGTLTLATLPWRPYSVALAAADATKVGTCNFDSARFSVDATGFVTLNSTGVLETLTGNSGGAISPTANNINTLGTGSITISGAGSTLTTQLTGLTNHAVLIGAGTATITKVGPTATAGQVLQSAGAAADPVFSTATYPATTTINQILYSSSNNVVAGLATANQGVLTTGTTGIPVITAMATNGQLIIGSTAGAPAAATLTAGTGISITNGSNSISIAVNGSVVGETITGDSGGALSPTAGNWNILGLSGSKTSGTGSTLTIKSPPFSQVGASATSALNTGEFVTAAVTRTLPVSAGLADGDLFIYSCTTAGALVIQAVGAQKIRIGTLLSSAAGTATSTAIGDSITLRFDATQGFFMAVSVIGTWLIG